MARLVSNNMYPLKLGNTLQNSTWQLSHGHQCNNIKQTTDRPVTMTSTTMYQTSTMYIQVMYSFIDTTVSVQYMGQGRIVRSTFINAITWKDLLTQPIHYYRKHNSAISTKTNARLNVQVCWMATQPDSSTSGSTVSKITDFHKKTITEFCRFVMW